MITIQNQTAERAPMSSLCEGLGNGLAALAAIDARIFGSHTHQPAPSLFRFVRNMVEELPPSGVTYTLGQVVIPDHASDIQILDGNKSEAVYNISGNLMMKIGTLISDSSMQARQNDPCASSIVRFFFLFGNLSIFNGDPILGGPEMFGVWNGRVVGEYSEGLDSQVYTHGSGGNWSRNWIGVNGETDIPFAHFSFDRAGFDLADDGPVQFDLYGSDLRKPKSIVCQLESRFLGVGDRVVAILVFESRVSGLAFFGLNPPKESLVCSLHPKQNVLQNLRMDFAKRFHPIFIISKDYLLVDSQQIITCLLVSSVSVQQTGIVERSANVEHPTQRLNLVSGGDQPIFVSFSHHGIHGIPENKSQDRKRRAEKGD
jgi:hypothetical protein